MSNVGDAVLRCQGVKKSFQIGDRSLDVLKGISLEIASGEAVCIVGASGAGKTTLLHILGTLDRPSGGTVVFDSKPVSTLNDEDLADFRNREMGFVFQFHHLLKEFTALENTMMPCRIAGYSKKEALYAAESLLVEVGLKDRLHHFPSQMSGGEQQRVAIARALVRGPRILFADEPTGNLDSANGEKIQQIFFRLKEQRKLTLIAVSHDRTFAERFPRTIRMHDGQVVV